LGTAIALVTLFPMIDGLFQAPPYIPPGLYAAMAAGVAGLTLAATTIPARLLLARQERRPS
ncbi:hypothetical protein, partial [Streptomyces albus]